jgi:Fur family transcriptional regulator, ferric uptake regulator
MRFSRNNGSRPRNGRTAASEALRGYLRSRGLRMTHERDALLRAALALHSHFTLDELTHGVMRRDSSASRATVFRALPILVEAGILQPAPPSGEARRFELALGREHHDHLRCRGCGRIVEFRCEEIERLQLAVARRHGFRLASHVHELVGDCPACRVGKPASARRTVPGARRVPRGSGRPSERRPLLPGRR